MPIPFISQAFHGFESGSRSTVVQSLGLMAALLASALIASTYFKAPFWILGYFAGLLALDFLVFLASYVYFALNDKDALRSERFSIQKMAIERGLVGDSATGLFVPESTTSSGVKSRQNLLGKTE